MKQRTFGFENLTVASPCTAKWEDMTGDERARHCALCERPVYNLSSMKGPEIAALIRETEGRRCVRFHRRADGTMLTEDCPVGLQRARRKAMGKVAALASLVFGGLAWKMFGDSEIEYPAIMGEMIVPEELTERYRPQP